jgi:hypothetical protein
MRLFRRPALLCALVLLILNTLIAAKLFSLEYSAYNGSNESTSIAISRVMAEHPGEWKWFPLWSGGMRFENTYLPLTHWSTAAFTLLTGYSPARSFHIVTAAFYALGAPAFFVMVLVLSRRLIPSFIAALAYSCISISALILPTIRADAGGPLTLRRFQVLAFYGEAAHTIALALLPLAVACFHFALTTREIKWKILAGVMTAAVILSNAFGIVALAVALLCWLLAFPSKPWWRAPVIIAAIGVVTYLWISPWLSPSMIRAIRINSPTADGDYRYTIASWIALSILLSGFLLLWFVLRRSRIDPYLRFFVLFAYVPAGIVLAWQISNVAVLAQPHRYHLQMDMALLAAIVFLCAAMLDRIPARAQLPIMALVIIALTFQTLNAVKFGWRFIRSADPTTLIEYKIAKWMDENRPGERAFISGSSCYWYNVFSDNPQFHGAHDPSVQNSFIRIPVFTIYTGMNAGARDAEYSVFWLKAFGARAISVSGPNGREYYKPFTNPRKFESVLPVLWREGDDTIYEVPSRSSSLAHVIPRAAVPARTPIHGLDIEPVEAFVAALEDPRYPNATFEWKGRNAAAIRASPAPDQVIAVQITYDSGWEAYANGNRLKIRKDAIGLMVIEPDCDGACEISLTFTGGTETVVTRAMSLSAVLIALAFVLRNRTRTQPRT